MPSRPSPEASSTPVQAYSPTARKLHWWTVALVAVMLPLGIAMDYRGNHLNLWDGLTNNLYSLHKLIGIVILCLVVTRLIYRFRNGAPADEPTLEWWQKLAAHVTHWSLYGLLIIVPLLGWVGVSRYGALDIFGIFSLPPLAAKNQDLAETVFWLHGGAALLLTLLIGAHVGAALFHHLIRKDGVLRRMLPGLKQKSGKDA
jgi:cytochrome b561